MGIMKSTKGMVNAFKAHAILVLCVLNLIHVSTKEQEGKTFVKRTRTKKCGIKVDCFYFEVLNPHCGNGTTLRNGSDYVVEFTAQDCKGHVLTKLAVSWFELFSKNKVIQSISCSNQKQCRLSGEALADLKGDLHFGIWIKVPGSNKLIRLPVYVRLKEKNISNEIPKAANKTEKEKTKKTKLTPRYNIKMYKVHRKKNRKKFRNRWQNERKTKNGSVAYVETAFYGSVQRINKTRPNTTNPETTSKPPAIISDRDQSTKSNVSRWQEKIRKGKMYNPATSDSMWTQIQLDLANAAHNKYNNSKQAKDRPKPKVHKVPLISVQVALKVHANHSSVNTSSVERDKVGKTKGNYQVTSTPYDKKRKLTEKNINFLSADEDFAKNKKFRKNVATCLNFLCQSPFTQQCVKLHVMQCIHYERGAKATNILKVIRSDVLHLLKMFNITSSDLQKVESFARKAAVAISHLNTSRLSAELGLAAGNLLKKLYNASYLASKTALQEELGNKLINAEKFKPTKIPDEKKEEKRIVSCLEGCNKTGNNLHWTSWESWSSCTSSCDKSVSIRLKTCEKGKYKPPHHLLHCDGYVTVQVRKCNYRPCETDQGGPTVIGMWSVWSSWSACSVTCGLGQESKSRTCGEKQGKPSAAVRTLFDARSSEKRNVSSCTGVASHSRLCITSSCNLDSEPSVRKVVEGSDTELNCGMDQGPRTRIYWITPTGQRISPSSRNPRFHINEDTLVVKEAQRYDSGVYHCVVVKQGQRQSTTDTRIEVLTCLSYPCQNEGTCEMTHNAQDRRMVVCHCPHGFHGNLCQLRKHSLQYTYILVAFVCTLLAFFAICSVAACITCCRNRRAALNRSKILENKDTAPDKSLLEVRKQEKQDLNSSIVSSDGSWVEISEKDYKDFQGQNLYKMYKENIKGSSESLPVLPDRSSEAGTKRKVQIHQKGISRKTGQKSNSVTKTCIHSAVEAVDAPPSPDIPTQSMPVQPDEKPENFSSATPKRSVAFQENQRKTNKYTEEQEKLINSREGENQTLDKNALEDSDYLQIQPDWYSSASQDYENMDRIVVITSDDMIGIDGDKALSESCDGEELDFTHRRTFLPHQNSRKAQNMPAKARVTPKVSSKIEDTHDHQYENGIEYIHKKTFKPSKRQPSPGYYYPCLDQRSPDNIGSGDTFSSTSGKNGILTEGKQSNVYYNMSSPKEGQLHFPAKKTNHTVGKMPFNPVKKPSDSSHASSLGILSSEHSSKIRSADVDMDRVNQLNTYDANHEPGYFMTSKAQLPEWDNYLQRESVLSLQQENGTSQKTDFLATQPQSLNTFHFGRDYLTQESEVKSFNTRMNDNLSNSVNLDHNEHGHFKENYSSELQENNRLSETTSGQQFASVTQSVKSTNSVSQNGSVYLNGETSAPMPAPETDKVDDTDSSTEDEGDTTIMWGMSSNGSQHTITAVSVNTDENLKSADLPAENKVFTSPFQTEMNQLIDTTWDSVQEEYSMPPQREYNMPSDESYEALQNRSSSSGTCCSNQSSRSSSSRQNDTDTIDYQKMGFNLEDVDDYGDNDSKVYDTVINKAQNTTTLSTNATQVESTSPRTRMCLNHYQMVYGAVGYHGSNPSPERPCCEGEEEENN